MLAKMLALGAIVLTSFGVSELKGEVQFSQEIKLEKALCGGYGGCGFQGYAGFGYGRGYPRYSYYSYYYPPYYYYPYYQPEPYYYYNYYPWWP